VREGDDFRSSMLAWFRRRSWVDDGFFVRWTWLGRWVEGVVGSMVSWWRCWAAAFWADGAGVGGGEGEEDVTGAVAGVLPSGPSRGEIFLATRLSWSGDEWGVGGDDDDDGVRVAWPATALRAAGSQSAVHMLF